MKSLAGKTVVITGAGSGIGKRMALICAREKANLAILDINEKNLKDTETDIKGLSARVQAYRCDVSRKEDIETAVKAIKKDFQSIDVLINNAGIVNGKSILDSSFEDIKRTIDINLMGVIWMTKCILPEMVNRNNGHIVNIASAAGLLAIPKMADYCATKFAVVGFSDALRMEMKKFGSKGVKVTCVCPSIIDTGMFTGFKAPLLN
ncbi:MAG: SDR family oxidoreductase, partial [Proteobacteria bacterium]|nr:SDR family oxidoreductase [Pseudomonadota bacterium]